MSVGTQRVAMRGISPTVREGSDAAFNEPSLTVGLVPRSWQHTFNSLPDPGPDQERLSKSKWQELVTTVDPDPKGGEI